jgi:tRNA1Val (adenine37-N6)-methyltransferase
MGNTWFQFQKFRVEQEKSAMKISTDAILLGVLADFDSPKQILDIGSGTGVIALMLAQRFEKARVTGIELDEDASQEAKSNFEKSDFAERLSISQGAIQNFKSDEKFDMIVSNPPYFPDHLKSRDQKRNQALHTDKLSFDELIISVDQLLGPNGVFWCILPPRQMEDLSVKLEEIGFFAISEIAVRDNPQKQIHRVVKSFSKAIFPFSRTEHSLKNTTGEYTDFYKSLISGFLLGY